MDTAGWSALSAALGMIATWLALLPAGNRERVWRWVGARFRRTPLDECVDVFIERLSVRVSNRDHGEVNGSLLLVSESGIEVDTLIVDYWHLNRSVMPTPAVAPVSPPGRIKRSSTTSFTIRLHRPDIDAILSSVGPHLPRNIPLVYEAAVYGVLTLRRGRRKAVKRFQLYNDHAAALTLSAGVGDDPGLR